MEGKEPSPEIVSPDQLIKQLGFNEDEKLQSIRHRIREAAVRGESTDAICSFLTAYDDQAQSTHNDPDPNKYQRACLGLILAKARIYYEIGDGRELAYKMLAALDLAENLVKLQVLTEEEFQSVGSQY